MSSGGLEVSLSIYINVSYNNMHSITLTGKSPSGLPRHAPSPPLYKRLNISETVQIPTPKPYIVMFLVIRHIK